MKQITIDGVTYNLTPVSDEEVLLCSHDGFNYYLGPEAPHKMNFEDAIIWCKSLGDNYELPNRLLLLVCYEDVTIRDKFKTDDYYWSSTEKSVKYGWKQAFGNGNQYNDTKYLNHCVRAVRKVSILTDNQF